MGGNPELLQDNETRLLFQPGNVQELSETLSSLAANPGLRERLAQASAHVIQERFSLKSSAERMHSTIAIRCKVFGISRR